jgi:hypothetical protein
MVHRVTRRLVLALLTVLVLLSLSALFVPLSASARSSRATGAAHTHMTVTPTPTASPTVTPPSGTFLGHPLYGSKTPGTCESAIGPGTFLAFYDFGITSASSPSPLSTLLLSGTAFQGDDYNTLAYFCNDYWPTNAPSVSLFQLFQTLHWPTEFLASDDGNGHTPTNTFVTPATTLPVPSVHLYGSSTPGSCSTTVSDAATLFAYDFAGTVGAGYQEIFRTSGKLGDPNGYQGKPTYALDDFSQVFCNDSWPAQDETVPTSQLLQTLHWPDDFFPAVWSTLSVTVTASLPAQQASVTYSPNDAPCSANANRSDPAAAPAAPFYAIQYFLGLPPERLNPRYQTDTHDLLCAQFWPKQDETLSEQKLLQLLHWPSDFLIGTPEQLAKTSITISAVPPGQVQQMGPYDPNAPFASEAANPPPQAKQFCFWNFDLAGTAQTVNLCDPVRQAVNGAADLIGEIYQSNASTLSFLWRTPTDAFHNDAVAGLLSMWNLSWAIVLAFLTAVIAWGALRSMVGSVVSFLAYAQITELLPRLIFALFAALLSKQVFLLLLQANNALSSLFSNTTLFTIVGHRDPGISVGLIQIAYGLLGFALIIEEATRIALIYLLFAASPLLFFFAALPETQHWAKASASAAVVVIFLQAVQSFTMDVGNRILMSILHGQSGTLSFLQILVAIAVLYLTIAEFFALLRLAFGSAGGFALAGGPLAVAALGQWGISRGLRAISNAKRAVGMGAAVAGWGSFRGTASALNALDRRLHPGGGSGRGGPRSGPRGGPPPRRAGPSGRPARPFSGSRTPRPFAGPRPVRPQTFHRSGPQRPAR